MPPKRKASAAAAGSRASASSSTATRAPRPSALAKENGLTALEEAEIREAFGLFAEPMDGEKDGVLPIGDLRRAMVELAEFVSILDPDDEGFAGYAAFVAICALKMHARAPSPDAQSRDIDEAFALFTRHGHPDAAAGAGAAGAGADTAAVISMSHLRRIAAMLKEDVADDVLRDMVLEANGGAGVAAGVDRDAFESVMRRAGVWR